VSVAIPLSAQQARILHHVAERRGESIDALVARALRELPDREPALPRGTLPRGTGSPVGGDAPSGTPGSPLDARTVEPGTGAGVAVRRGEVLRVEQVVGEQGVDVELFALRDRRLRLDAGRTRSLEGARPRLGTTLWSAPPDELALATIVADTAPGHDLLYPACSDREYELATGCRGHASCRSIELAVARTWGLDERDLHDPLNLWLAAGVRDDGALWWRHTRTAPGDHVELLAHVDLLAIVNPCANDIFGLYRFDVRPVGVAIRQAGDAERERWLRDAPPPGEEELRPLPGVEPTFDLSGLERVEVDVRLDAEAAGQVARLRTIGTLAATTDGEVLRAAFFRWWASTEAAQVPFAREE
jgi:uncharacterized protein YcgI (DUF1989 family)